MKNEYIAKRKQHVDELREQINANEHGIGMRELPENETIDFLIDNGFQYSHSIVLCKPDSEVIVDVLRYPDTQFVIRCHPKSGSTTCNSRAIFYSSRLSGSTEYKIGYGLRAMSKYMARKLPKLQRERRNKQK